MHIFPVVHRANGFRLHRPWSWIKPHALYVRIEGKNSDMVRKTQEIQGIDTIFEWNKEIP